MDGISVLNTKVQSGALKIPQPPEGLSRWPLIGQAIDDQWAAAANVKTTLQRYAPQIKNLSLKLLDLAANATLGVILFAVSILVAGPLMANTK